MRRLVLSRRANEYIRRQFLFIRENRNTETAEKVMSGLIATMEHLLRHPQLGKVGRKPNTRELICPPYIVTYRAEQEIIYVVSVLHGAQKRPELPS